MALIGLSLIFASVVYVFIRPPHWQWLHTWPIFRNILAATTQNLTGNDPSSSPSSRAACDKTNPAEHDEKQQQQQNNTRSPPPSTSSKSPPPPLIVPPPTIAEPHPESNDDDDEDGSTTPTAPSAPPSLMLPPPRPSPRPAVPSFPAANSPQRARGPLPDRSPFSTSSSSLLSTPSSLAPPPTHSSKPDKPSRKVILTPGHSPLDWARISGPNCDLRGLPASTPYLRVTPSMLKRQTGRKGSDAWMALNGRVYNVSPYAAFHPGGVPELMRGAGKDATKLFGEIHPWVNYETMLSACLVGLLVDEPEAGHESEMDKMD